MTVKELISVSVRRNIESYLQKWDQSLKCIFQEKLSPLIQPLHFSIFVLTMQIRECHYLGTLSGCKHCL